MKSSLLALAAGLILLVSGCVAEGGDAPDEAARAKGAKPGTGTNQTGDFNATRLRIDQKTLEGGFAVGTQEPLTATTDCGQLGREGIDQKTFEWALTNKEADGNASVVKFVRLKLSPASATTLDIDIQFISPSGTVLKAGTGPDADETVESFGINHPAGTYKLRVYGCNLADIKFKLETQADYHSV